MSEVLILDHATTDVVTELLDLISNIPQESVAGPTADKHDSINRYFRKVHCHGGTGTE